MIAGISFIKLVAWILLVIVTGKVVSAGKDSHKHYDSYSDGVEDAYLSGRLKPRR